MDTAQAICLLERTERELKSILETFDAVWGGEDGLAFRQANPVAFSRLADAVSLAERAGQKVRKAIDAFRRPVSSK